MPKSLKVSPFPKMSEKVSLLGGGLRGPSTPARLFPGDLISFRAQKPYEWLPWFGVVLSPNNPMARYMTKACQECRKESSLTRTNTKVSTLTTNDDVLSTIEEEDEDAISIVTKLIPIPEDGLVDPVYVNWAHSQRVAELRDRTQIAVVDRSLVKGQRVKNEEGIRGTVVDRTDKVTLQVISTSHVIDNVNAQLLSPVAVWYRGRELLYDGWVGVVTVVRRLVTCRLENGGSIFHLKTNETDGFMKPDPFWGVGMPCPGLSMKFAPATMKKAVFSGTFMRFLHRWVPPVSYFYTQRSACKTIGVETIGMDVMWIERCPNVPVAPIDPPPTTLDKSAILQAKPLGLPNFETIGLNSVRMYGMKRNDALMSYPDWYAGFSDKFFGSPETSVARLTPAPSVLTNVLANGYQIPVKVIFRQTEVEVEWDNGFSGYVLAAKIPSILNPPKRSEFETGFVVESAGHDDAYGVVLSRVGMEDDNAVKVRWIGIGLEEPEDLGTAQESVCDLLVHPTISTYGRGVTVFLKDHPQGHKVGTITGLDIKTGKVTVAVPDVVEPIPVYAHVLTQLSKRTYWNFAERKWIQEGTTVTTAEPSTTAVDTVESFQSDVPNPVIDSEEERAHDEILAQMKADLDTVDNLEGNEQGSDIGIRNIHNFQNEPKSVTVENTDSESDQTIESDLSDDTFHFTETKELNVNPEMVKGSAEPEPLTEPSKEVFTENPTETELDELIEAIIKTELETKVAGAGTVVTDSDSTRVELISDFNLLGDFPESDSNSVVEGTTDVTISERTIVPAQSDDDKVVEARTIQVD